MNFELTAEQTSILDAVSRVLAPYRSIDHTSVVQRTIYASELERTLAKGGFLSIGGGDAESRVTAALIVAEIARLPVCLEATASLLVRPAVCPEALGPIALICGDAQRPTRFLPQARSALIANTHGVRLLRLEPGDVEEVTSLFAYPVGRLRQAAAAHATPLSGEAAVNLHRVWRIGIALEIYGALHTASAITVEHLMQRRQFGKPLGAFQAIQHRLAMNATTIEAIRWLALKAAFSQSTSDASLATSYAQPAVATIAYDLHQFSGAMGLTLEYPLHLYTYRARMLQSELGGGHAQIEDAVAETWREPQHARARRA
jgi:alkylation response protein AidB-like acyl-CoA dehydrogenase